MKKIIKVYNFKNEKEMAVKSDVISLYKYRRKCSLDAHNMASDILIVQ